MRRAVILFTNIAQTNTCHFSTKIGRRFFSLPPHLEMPALRVCESFRDATGSTPLLKLRSASEETGCTIWGKCEFLNPGGSVKDRPAVYMLKKAEEAGVLAPGAWVVEASAGNTAIAITLAAKERGYRVICVMPDTLMEEKRRLLRVLGAIVLPVPFQKITHPNHYVSLAGRLAEKLGGFYCGQFDNKANRLAHFETTGPEIWNQTNGKIDAFICAVGTGGTLAGVASSLRVLRRKQPGEENPMGGEMLERHLAAAGATHSLACTDYPIPAGSSSAPSDSGEGSNGVTGATDAAARVKKRLAEVLASGGPCIGLADIRGAGLFRLYTTGTLEAEGSSIVENIGQNRVTGNLEGFFPDFACEISDEEALTWTHRLLQEEGLPLGMTSGVNVAGAVRLARSMGPGHHIVTVLCDYGHLYAKKQWNPEFLRSQALPEASWIDKEVPHEVLSALKQSFVSTNEDSTP